MLNIIIEVLRLDYNALPKYIILIIQGLMVQKFQYLEEIISSEL